MKPVRDMKKKKEKEPLVLSLRLLFFLITPLIGMLFKNSLLKPAIFTAAVLKSSRLAGSIIQPYYPADHHGKVIPCFSF